MIKILLSRAAKYNSKLQVLFPGKMAKYNSKLQVLFLRKTAK